MRFKIALLAAAGLPYTALAASGSGVSTGYWDCCKPSCAWSGKAAVSKPVTTCDKNDSPLADADAQSGCNGGPAFACTNNSPFAVNDNLAYGFAATALSGGTESSWCCACYAYVFPPLLFRVAFVRSGKRVANNVRSFVLVSKQKKNG